MHTRDFPNLLRPGDVVVLNETRVMPARLNLRRLTGGAVEVLALEEIDNGNWEALVRPSRKIQVGEELLDKYGKAVLRIEEVTHKGTRYISSIKLKSLISLTSNSEHNHSIKFTSNNNPPLNFV